MTATDPLFKPSLPDTTLMRTGSFPKESRSSHTPVRISRFDPCTKFVCLNFVGWTPDSRRPHSVKWGLTCAFLSCAGRI